MALALRRLAPNALRPAARRNMGRAFFQVRAFTEDEASASEKKDLTKAPKEHSKQLSHRQQAEALPFMRMSDAMRQMQREMDAMMHSFGLWDPLSASLMRDAWGLPGATFEERDLAPLARMMPTRMLPVEVEETDTAYMLHADVPGFTKQDIKVTLDPATSMLTIHGEKKQEEKGHDKKRGSMMRSHMAFTRSFSVPQDVDLDKPITAKTEHGVLTLTLPKAPAPPKPSVKEITVE